MSQADLARRVNVTRGAVSNWIRERNEPSGATMRAILGALEVEPAYFWGAAIPRVPDEPAAANG